MAYCEHYHIEVHYLYKGYYLYLVEIEDDQRRV